MLIFSTVSSRYFIETAYGDDCRHYAFDFYLFLFSDSYGNLANVLFTMDLFVIILWLKTTQQQIGGSSTIVMV